MLDTLQDDRLGGAVDAADTTPIAMPHPNPVLMATQRPNRRMCRKGIGGEGLDPEKQGAPVSSRQHSEILCGSRGNDQSHLYIVGGSDQTVNDSVSPRATKR